MNNKPQCYNKLPLAPDDPPAPKRRSLVARFRAWLRRGGLVRIWLDKEAAVAYRMKGGRQ